MKDWTAQIRAGCFLEGGAVTSVVDELFSAGAGDEEKADFLEVLHHRGETPEEVRAFAEAFLRLAEPFDVPADFGGVLDVCGTGGDRLGLFNVSTSVMFVAAGAGAKLVKHGNRGITSRSGGADVLEALGIPPDLPLERLHAMLAEAGAVFLFAPRFHPAFKAVAPARKVLAARGSASIFNMLGPLLNPARPAFQLAGVFSESLLPVYAEVLPALGRERAWVVHGRTLEGGVMDEISTLGPTTVVEANGAVVNRRELTPADLGVSEASIGELCGGDAEENAILLREILGGQRRGAARDMVLVNAAGALQAAGMAADWKEGKLRAEESINSGAALRVLETLQRLAAAG
jgi:anthranilate phosphoribosyltransferase